MDAQQNASIDVLNPQQSILIVDDSPSTACALQEFLKLRRPTWRVECANDLGSAVKAVNDSVADRRPFGVIITDLHMENDEERGIQLILAVRQIDPLAMTILYTGRADLRAKLEASQLGAFDLLVKASSANSERILERTEVALRYRSWAVRNVFLQRYFDPRLFETIENDPSMLIPKTRDVTIVFWDIRGFSALCEKLQEDTDLVAGFLTEFYEAAATAVFEHHGIVDKFIGDGVMALFGVLDQTPTGLENGAVAAVRAALGMLVEFDILLQKWMRQWELRAMEHIDLRLGCGIHTGRALVGNLGTKRRDQFTAVGTHVNFAQRIESNAAADDDSLILISQTTRARIQHAFAPALLREIHVKNMRGSFPVYSVAAGRRASR